MIRGRRAPRVVSNRCSRGAEPRVTADASARVPGECGAARHTVAVLLTDRGYVRDFNRCERMRRWRWTRSHLGGGRGLGRRRPPPCPEQSVDVPALQRSTSLRRAFGVRGADIDWAGQGTTRQRDGAPAGARTRPRWWRIPTRVGPGRDAKPGQGTRDRAGHVRFRIEPRSRPRSRSAIRGRAPGRSLEWRESDAENREAEAEVGPEAACAPPLREGPGWRRRSGGYSTGNAPVRADPRHLPAPLARGGAWARRSWRSSPISLEVDGSHWSASNTLSARPVALARRWPRPNSSVQETGRNGGVVHDAAGFSRARQSARGWPRRQALAGAESAARRMVTSPAAACSSMAETARMGRMRRRGCRSPRRKLRQAGHAPGSASTPGGPFRGGGRRRRPARLRGRGRHSTPAPLLLEVLDPDPRPIDEQPAVEARWDGSGGSDPVRRWTRFAGGQTQSRTPDPPRYPPAREATKRRISELTASSSAIEDASGVRSSSESFAASDPAPSRADIASQRSGSVPRHKQGQKRP